MKHLLLTFALVGLFAYLLGGAIDYELASGGALSERTDEPADRSGLVRGAGETFGGGSGGTRPTGAASVRSESVPTYQGKPILWWAKRAVQARRDANARGRTIRRLRAELANREIGPTLAIRLVFGHHADAALRVAWCESRWHTGAQNGQYLGLFQMGSYARGRYGHSSSALGQAQAAYRYFADSGYDWSPWSCKP